MKAVGYERVSDPKQAMQGVSLDEQHDRIGEFVAREGYELVETYVERGRSAFNGKRRPQFERMLADARSSPRPFDAIIVHSRSRFYRNASRQDELIDDLRAIGIEVLSATEPNANDLSGDLLRRVLAVVDQHSSETTAKLVKGSMRQNAEQGFWNGSAPPFGYATYVAETRGNKQKKKLRIDDVESPVVDLIFRMLERGADGSGPLGLKKTVTHLNKEGYRTRRGKLWHVGPLHNMVCNPVYAGSYIYNRTNSRTGAERAEDEQVRVPCPAIITVERFDAVQQLLKSRNPKIAPPRVISGPILLTGLLKCKHCGSAMTIRTGKSGRYRYYTCAAAQARGRTACSGQSVPMPRMDDLVTSALAERLFEPTRLRVLLQEVEQRGRDAANSSDDELIRIEQDLASAKTRLTRLHDAIERGVADLDDQMFVQRIEKAKAERDVAQAAKSRVLARMGPEFDLTNEKIVQFAEAMRSRITEGDVPFRKAYVRATVQDIVVSETEVVIRGRSDTLRKRVNDGTISALPEVPSSVQKWCTRRDSNS